MTQINFVQTIIENKLKSLDVDFSFVDSSVFSDGNNDQRTYQLKFGNENPVIIVNRIDECCRINMISNKGFSYSSYRIFDFQFKDNTKEMKYDSLKRSTEILNIMIKDFVEWFQ